MNTEDLQFAVDETKRLLTDSLHDYNIAKNGTDEDVANQGNTTREGLIDWSETVFSDAIASVDVIHSELNALYDKMFNS